MPMPAFCGSRTDSPQVGSSPTRAWVSAKRACSEAIRMSQYSASSSPPVTAAPLMAPITGLVIGGHCGEISGSCDESPSSLRSRPAQNTGSVPVTMTTSTSSSATASRSAPKKRLRRSADNAFAGLWPVQRQRAHPVLRVDEQDVVSHESNLSWRYVPKHHGAARPATGGDRRGDRGRRPPVRPSGQRHDPAVGCQHRGLRDRGRRSHRSHHPAAGRPRATTATAEDRASAAEAGSGSAVEGRSRETGDIKHCMTTTLTQPALKEWSAAVRALLDGRQTVLLRKGGVHEKRFAVTASRFLLFPTVAHSHAERVRPEHRDLLDPAAADSTVDALVIRAGAKVVAAVEVNRPEALDKIASMHIWTAESVRADRLDFRPRHRLTVLVVQASPLVEPVRLARTPEYAGCKSWVPLPVAPAWADPVHDDAALQEIAERVRSSVG